MNRDRLQRKMVYRTNSRWRSFSFRGASSVIVPLYVRGTLLTIASLAGLLLSVGCSSPRDETSVQGRVIVEGQPLNEGLITFVPIEGTPGKKLSTEISSGKYALPSKCSLQSGRFRVEIYALPAGIRAMAEGRPVSHPREKYREIDRRFNEASILTCEVHPGLLNQADFEVLYEKK